MAWAAMSSRTMIGWRIGRGTMAENHGGPRDIAAKTSKAMLASRTIRCQSQADLGPLSIWHPRSAGCLPVQRASYQRIAMAGGTTANSFADRPSLPGQHT